jgi:hypothetical protein
MFPFEKPLADASGFSLVGTGGDQVRLQSIKNGEVV